VDDLLVRQKLRELVNQALCVFTGDFIIKNGEERIRTSVRCDPKADFESAAFNHSATSPEAQKAIIANSVQNT
jgi:hypothetical protein